MRQPTGRLNPGEQNWRSSYPYGEKSVTEDAAGPCLSTCATARSTSALPRRLFLYVNPAPAPSPARTSPCLIRETRASLRASQVIEPIVPGMNRKRYDYRRDARRARTRASSAATAIADRLSLASDGWQTWQETRTSSGFVPGT